MSSKLALNDRDRRTLIVGSITIALLMLIARGVPALRTWEADRSAQAEASAQQLFAMRRGLSVLPALRDSVLARQGRLAVLDSALLSGATPSAIAARLASSLEDLADDNALRITALQLHSDSTANAGLARVEVRVTGVTDVAGLVGFLRDIEGGAASLAVRELAVSQPEPAAPESKPEMLRVELLVGGLGAIRVNTVELHK